ncbi:MAG: mannose-1-phosphate guanylyltransferase/mannose-6-phosphate isomerase [Alphaproteobacteria bacterium]
MVKDRAGRIHPVILSGGAGTRLWPMSRELYPKQLLALNSEQSLLQETVRRASDERHFHAPLVICNEEHRFIVAEQLRRISVTPRSVVLEPFGRNTAPAAAVASLMLMESDPDAVLLVMPSDHVIGDESAFLEAVTAGAGAARAGGLVTLGVTPEGAETGYGYIRRGDSLKGHPGCFGVARFVEKPDRDTAQSFVAAGDWHWNSGIFLFKAQAFLSELERHQPEMVAACRAAVKAGKRDLDFFRIGREAFQASPAVSIDYAVMEHTSHAVVVPVTMAWSDVGSWSALWQIGDKDNHGNVCIGDVLVRDVRNCYIRSEHRLVAAVGLEDVVIVATDDAVMVAPREHAQAVRELVEALKAQGRTEHIVHSLVFRPWGSYRSIDSGERFQVKQIVVNPGAKLSLQMHHHRAEHWVVVNGTARVTRGEETFLIQENESTFIPLGVAHRIENPGKVPLRLIEVQSGPYLGEDDIVRFEDSYGRT